MLGVGLYIYGLFHGYFDSGRFKVMHAETSSSGMFAMVAQRSDNQSLGGLEDFVVVGDHIFSSSELRHAYYHSGVVFEGGANCLIVHWENEKKLVVACPGEPIDPAGIAVQKNRIGAINIIYEGIPAKAPK